MRIKVKDLRRFASSYRADAESPASWPRVMLFYFLFNTLYQSIAIRAIDQRTGRCVSLCSSIIFASWRYNGRQLELSTETGDK